MEPRILRLDDVGAASKQYEQYAKIHFGQRTLLPPAWSPLNWLGIKRLPIFRGWGEYAELTVQQWEEIIAVLQKYRAKLTLGITAAWVERDGSLTPFNQKYPQQAALLRDAAKEGIFEIANHGLTHCVITGGKYLPQTWTGNRVYHREFWDWVPPETQREHIFRAQDILHTTFGVDVVTFIPPGHVFTTDTEKYAREAGIQFISATAAVAPTGAGSGGLRYVSAPEVLAFHDRELVLEGIPWLEQLLCSERNASFLTIAEYGAMLDHDGVRANA